MPALFFKFLKPKTMSSIQVSEKSGVRYLHFTVSCGITKHDIIVADFIFGICQKLCGTQDESSLDFIASSSFILSMRRAAPDGIYPPHFIPYRKRIRHAVKDFSGFHRQMRLCTHLPQVESKQYTLHQVWSRGFHEYFPLVIGCPFPPPRLDPVYGGSSQQAVNPLRILGVYLRTNSILFSFIHSSTFAAFLSPTKHFGTYLPFSECRRSFRRRCGG